jgi:predicted ATPase/DNA-binding SARP family transcriptional activator
MARDAGTAKAYAGVMEFRILGPLEVSENGEAISIGGRKERALLALLVVNAPSAVSVDRMADELWGDEAPPTAIKTLRSYVSRLRRRLGEGASLITVGSGYALDIGPDEIDAARFERLLGASLEHQRTDAHLLAAEQLADALSLWRGTALADLDDHPFAQLEATRLEGRRLEALEARIASDLELGRHRRLITELEELVERHPLRETFWSQLMLAFYRSGRQADALRAFQSASTRLGQELGIEPSLELRRLEEAILLQDRSIESPTHVPISHNLPSPRDSFIGREAELGDIIRLLTDYRCVTLTGVGGCGKTRLGLEAARQALEDNPDGARYIELASLSDADTLAEHVLLSFGEPGSHAADPGRVLVDHLQNRRFLLVFDNCEHLVAPVAELADRLLDGCASLSILATSRERLGIGGEANFHVSPLAVPAMDDQLEEVRKAEAVRLFVDRVRNHQHDFEVDEHSRTDVVRICRTLDGIPLALELAAARARTMSLPHLVERLEERFALLTQGSRTAPPRQQTLRAAIDWSHDLLSDGARRLLRRLALFGGGLTLDAACSVAGDDDEAATLDALDELVDKSIIEVDDGRYRLLETIRQYAFEQLVLAAEAPSIGRRFRDWFTRLAENADSEIRGAEQRRWWTRLEHEHDNLRAAIRWCLNNDDPDGALRLTSAMGWFWFMRGYWREAARWLERGLDAERASALWRAHAITRAGAGEIIRANLTFAPYLDEALQIYQSNGDRAGLAWLTFLRGYVAAYTDEAEARERLDESYGLYAELDDAWGMAFVSRYIGDLSEGADAVVGHHMASRDGFAALGDRWNVAFTLYNLGGWYFSVNRLAESEEVCSEARAIAAEIGDVVWYAHATRTIGMAAYAGGDHLRAEAFLREALDDLELIGDETCAVTMNSFLGMVELQRGRLGPAARYLGAALRGVLSVDSSGRRGGDHLVRAALLAAAAGDLEAAARFAGAPAPTTTLSPTYEMERDRLDSLLAGLDTGVRVAITTGAGQQAIPDIIGEAVAWFERLDNA